MRPAEAAAAGNLGILYQELGRSEEAQGHQERQLALSREIGSRQGEAIALGNLGNVAYGLGRREEAIDRHERHLALSREIEDRQGEAIALVNLGTVRLLLGDRAGAREELEASRAISTAIGIRREEGYALHALALEREQAGDRDGAARLFVSAIDLRREIEYRSGLAATLVASSRVVGEQEARSRLPEALALAREVRAAGTHVLAACELAVRAEENAAAALAALGEHESRMGLPERMEARHLVGRATGDPAHAAEATRLLAHLRDHAPAAWRETMVRDVPLHAAIVASSPGQRPPETRA